jgi:hypothetical protein
LGHPYHSTTADVNRLVAEMFNRDVVPALLREFPGTRRNYWDAVLASARESMLGKINRLLLKNEEVSRCL